MSEAKKQESSRNIAHHIFSGSITMIGVCITIIALFRALKTSADTFADNLLGADTFIFILAALLSYSSLRKENDKRTERLADILFFTGMLIMILVGIVILYSTY